MAWRSPIFFLFIFWLWIRPGNVPLPGTLSYLYGDLTGTYYIVNPYRQYRSVLAACSYGKWLLGTILVSNTALRFLKIRFSLASPGKIGAKIGKIQKFKKEKKKSWEFFSTSFGILSSCWTRCCSLLVDSVHSANCFFRSARVYSTSIVRPAEILRMRRERERPGCGRLLFGS